MSVENTRISKSQSQNIIIVGFMGTGKTTVGKILAGTAGMQFYDTDMIIEEHEGISIAGIFRTKGESYFRKLEHEVLKWSLKNKNMVLATGGGIVLNPDNIKIIKSRGLAVALTAHPKIIAERLQGALDRPLLLNGSIEATIDKLYKERAELYDFADVVIQTENKSPFEIAEEILKKLSLFNL